MFLMENIILSENREWLCTTYGEDQYHMGYNFLSTSACLSILYGFLKHKGTGRTWSNFAKGSAPLPLKMSSILLQAFGLACFAQLAPALQIPIALETNDDSSSNNAPPPATAAVQSDVGPSRRPGNTPTPTTTTNAAASTTPKSTFKARCPMDFKARADLGPDAVYGIERITRHHNLWALASLGVGTAIVTPFIVESLFFGGPLLLATFGTAHQDSRFKRGMGGSLSVEKEKKTSNLPFAALLVGKQDWRKLFDEVKWINGGVASLLVVLAHVR